MYSDTLLQPPASALRFERELRRTVELTGHCLLDNGSIIAVRVLDLSYNGCRISSPVALLAGVKLQLSVLRLGSMEATVRWYANGEAGLCFRSDGRWAKGRQKRTQVRFVVSAQVSLRRFGRQPYVAKVTDLSAGGCKVEFVERPKVGEELWAKFDRLDSLRARVCWVDGFHSGIEFARAIYPAVFELLLARLQA